MNYIGNVDLIDELQKSGLSDKACAVYATLLETGGAYPSRIAELTHINRSTVYKILVDLSVKGLVNEVDKDKKLFYQIERPQQLLKFAKNRKELAETHYDRIKQLLPHIEGLYATIPNKPKIRFFENRAGIESIFDDHVSVKKPYEMLGFANTAELEKFMTPEYLKKYVKRKEKARITTRGIVPDSKVDKGYTSRMYKGVQKQFWLDLRYIPKDEFPFNGEITIYAGNKVSIINFNDRHLVGIIIEDPAIHEMMTRIFELAWRGAGK